MYVYIYIYTYIHTYIHIYVATRRPRRHPIYVVQIHVLQFVNLFTLLVWKIWLCNLLSKMAEGLGVQTGWGRAADASERGA